MPWERPVSTKAEGRPASPRSLKSTCCGGNIREETEDLVVLGDWWWPYREVMESCSPRKDCPWRAGRVGQAEQEAKVAGSPVRYKRFLTMTVRWSQEKCWCHIPRFRGDHVI